MYGTKHLIGLLVLIVLSAVFFILMHFFVNKRSENARRWALKGIYIFLLSLEILKYILLFRTDGNIGPGNFPWALCSMPLYLFPIVAFSKGKVAEFIKPAAFSIGLLAGLITLLYPSNVLHVDISWLSNGGFNFSAISFLYHGTMVVFAIYMLISKIYKIKASDYWKALVVILGLAIIAIILNEVIPNADFFLLKYGYGNPLIFVKEMAGQFAFVITMFVVGAVALFLMYGYFIIKHLILSLKKRKIS